LDVYVDESGDLGFSRKSTAFFVVAYITCDPSISIRIEMKRVLKRLHDKGKYHRAHDELKFSRMNDYCRKYVLERIAQSDSSVGVVILEKRCVHEKLRSDLTVLYNYVVVHNLVSALLPFLEIKPHMQIVFDKSLSKKRIESFNHYIKEKASYLFFEKGNKFPYDCILANHVDSKTEPCLQASDSVAGAYFQMCEHNDSSYVDIIKNKISSFRYLWRK